MAFRGVWTRDSCFLCRDTSSSIGTSPGLSPCRRCSFDPVIHKHTGKLISFRKTLLSVEGTASWERLFTSLSFLYFRVTVDHFTFTFLKNKDKGPPLVQNVSKKEKKADVLCAEYFRCS